MVHLGFDASTTGAGAVLLRPDDQIAHVWSWHAPKSMTGKEHVDERVFAIGEWAEEVLRHAEGIAWQMVDSMSCSIEAPFFRGASSAALAEAQGAIKSRRACQWGRYTAAEVKATAHRLTGVKTSGKGLGKAPMWDAARAHWGGMLAPLLKAVDDTHPAFGDVVDALWVAKTDQLACAATAPVVLDGAR